MQGKRDDQYENAARMWIYAAAGILIMLILLGVWNSCQGQEVGYYVVIDRDAPTRFVKIEKTLDTAEVNAIFKDAFNLDDFSIVEAMDSTGKFQAYNLDVWVYCEERWVVKRRNGKERYKKIHGDRFKREFAEADSVFWGGSN